MKNFQKAVNASERGVGQRRTRNGFCFIERDLSAPTLDVDWFRRGAGFRQCRHLGNRTRHIESKSAAHDCRFRQRSKPGLRRNLVMGNERGTFGRIRYRLSCSGSLFKC